MKIRTNVQKIQTKIQKIQKMIQKTIQKKIQDN